MHGSSGALASGAPGTAPETGFPSASCAIRGVVTDYRTGSPLARTQVMVNPVTAITVNAQTTVYTDSSGAFLFPSLPPGVYRLAAQRPHYARYQHGALNWNSQGAPIVLEPGSVFAAAVRLRRLGVITGRVVDVNQVGLEDHTVVAYRMGTRLSIAGRARTDDRGVYRLIDLEPGRYFVRTSARQIGGEPGLLPMFYKDVSSRREAQALEVRLDEEVEGIDFQPVTGRLISLSGTVSGPLPAKVTLLADVGVRELTVEPSVRGGEFEMQGLVPGTYEIYAESGQGPTLQVAEQAVTLAKDQEQVALKLGPAPVFSVSCQDSPGHTVRRPGVLVFLNRRDITNEVQQTLYCGDQRTLRPGVYEASVAPSGREYVKSLTGGTYADDTYEIDVNAQEPAVLGIELGQTPGTLRGVVTTPDGQPAVGAPVYLRPDGADLYVRAGGIRTMRAGGSGEFAFVSLPPGRYEVLSAFDVEEAGDRAWSRVETKTVDLKDGAEEKLEITLATAR